MTLRGADLRFVLSHRVETAVVLPGDRREGLGRVAAALVAAGVDLRPEGDETVDLVVAGAADADRSLAVPGRSHMVLGRPATSAVQRAGTHRWPHLLAGDLHRPTTLVPLDRAVPLRWYLSDVAASPSASGRLRNRVAAAALDAGAPPAWLAPPRRRLSVLGPNPGPHVPRLLAAAAHQAGLPQPRDWVLALGRGDDLQRAVFHVLGESRWVAKFTRVPGATAAFDRDEVGLGLAADAAGVVAAHAPRLLARLEVDGLPMSVESAAVGRPLLDLLSTGDALRMVDAVAAWVVEVGASTAVPARALDGERARLAHEVLPHWLDHGAPHDLLESLSTVPGVLQHNDLGSWNVVTDGHVFRAVDWESARRCGLPLWDLIYLLGDALVRLDGPADPDVLLRRCLELFRGTGPGSPTLFRWVRAAVTRLGLPAEAVGPVATMCWLHHGLSATARVGALAGADAAPLGHLARLAGPWLADPDLGPAWSAWRCA
ncbi:MAG: hypothetical protein ACR2FG_04655 [Marmoricola sp.]